MGMRIGNVYKEESDGRNEARVVESRRCEYCGDLFKDGLNPSCIQVAWKKTALLQQWYMCLGKMVP